MVTNNQGNMRNVFLQYAQAAEQATRDAQQHPMSAEIVPELSPKWHVITTEPGQDGIALGHLIGRRFGAYQPMFTKVTKGRMRNGAQRTRLSPLFPGYLFLFVWGIEQHRHRIQACPGVHAILMDGSRAAVIPDRFIDQLQAREFNMTAIPPRRSKRKKYRQAADDLVEIVAISPKSYWSGIEALEPQERIGLLHKALGLASSPGEPGKPPP